MYIDEKLIKILEPHRGETIDVSYAISLIKTIAEEYETEQCNIPIVSTRTFEKEIELYVDTETDEWVLKHKGVIKKRAKSKFKCLLTKQEIKKRLGV
jgi:hypothetical protein